MPGDFREGMVKKQLGGVETIILVLSGKGGVGKSVVSASIAAILADQGLAVGLMDADIYGPSSAILFGAHLRPVETKAGLVPPVMRGVKVMSVDLFAPGMPVPLTGRGAGDVVKEMLALTSWGRLDYLVVDMPPATADITLLFTSLRREGLAALVVTTSDRLSLTVAHRMMQILRGGKVPVSGVLGNMHRPSGTGADGPERLAREFRVPFLGELPYDPSVPQAAGSGSVGKLVGTRFGRALRRAAKERLGPEAGRA